MEDGQASPERGDTAGEALEACREAGLRMGAATRSSVLLGAGSSTAGGAAVAAWFEDQAGPESRSSPAGGWRLVGRPSDVLPALTSVLRGTNQPRSWLS